MFATDHRDVIRRSKIHPRFRRQGQGTPTALREAPGMRERSAGLWELVVEAGRDPVTGRTRQVSRTFRGSMREAKVARAELLVEVSKGRHTGARATLDDLFADW